MNREILHNDVQKFIKENSCLNIPELILKGSPYQKVSIQEIAQQIIGKQKASKKLPTWFLTDFIIYPPKLNLEQTSSEITANYKANLVSGKICVDITGGFGVDTFYFSKQFQKVVHCEIDEELSKISKHNSIQLKANNIDYYVKDGIDFISSTNQKFDCIYVDPSRRNQSNGKVFLLEDCSPNIPENISVLLEKSETVIIKYSPMLDIQNGIESLQNVKQVHVIAVENEVKELLFLLHRNFDKATEIKTINFKKNQVQRFDFFKNKQCKVTYSNALIYLYEPNAAILKSGAFLEISEKYKLHKLHQNTHLYTSNKKIDFPGRVFKIQEAINFDKIAFKNLKNLKANVTTRNFPLSVDQIRKKLTLKSGGDLYLFFITDIHNNLMIIKTTKA